MKKHYYVVFCAAKDQFPRFARRNKVNNHCFILEKIQVGFYWGFIKVEQKVERLEAEFIPGTPLEDIVNQVPDVFQVLELRDFDGEDRIDHLRLRRFTSSECVKHVIGIDEPKANDPQKLHDYLLLQEYAVRVWRPRAPELVAEERIALEKRTKALSE